MYLHFCVSLSVSPLITSLSLISLTVPLSLCLSISVSHCLHVYISIFHFLSHCLSSFYLTVSNLHDCLTVSVSLHLHVSTVCLTISNLSRPRCLLFLFLSFTVCLYVSVSQLSLFSLLLPRRFIISVSVFLFIRLIVSVFICPSFFDLLPLISVSLSLSVSPCLTFSLCLTVSNPRLTAQLFHCSLSQFIFPFLTVSLSLLSVSV